MVDVSDILAEDLKINALDESITVEGDIECGNLKTHYLRRFLLPPCANTVKIQAGVSCDGILTIIVPKKVSGIPENPAQ